MTRASPIVWLMLLLVLTMLSPGAQAADTGGSRVLKVAYTDDVSTFDPDDGIILFGLDAMRAIYEGLVQYRPGSTDIEGWLASSWTVSPDGRTYTFTLRDGVRFDHGHRLTASDVLASFRRRSNPKMALSYFLDDVQNMAAPDPLTFVITLSAPQPAFLDRLASPWGPKVINLVAVEQHATGWLTEHAAGSGPYRLVEFTRGQRYVLQKNPDYWGAPPYFDRIELLIVPNLGQQMLMLQRGELDILDHGYPFDQLDRLPAGLSVDAHDAISLEMASFNQTKVLGDPSIRRAVLTAINPAGWLQDAFGAFATQANSLYPKAMITTRTPLKFPDDVGEARRIAAAAAPFSIEIGYTDEEAPVQQRVAEFMVSLLKQVGIVATVHVVPLDQESGLGHDLQHAPDIWLSQNYPDAAHPATQVGVFFQTGAALNLLGYSSNRVDSLAAEAATLTNAVQRDQAYLAISQILIQDGAFIPLADIKDVIVYRDDLIDLNTRPALPWAVDYETIRRR
jgi:peptide/nickel transport system substrate-binding protein